MQLTGDAYALLTARSTRTPTRYGRSHRASLPPWTTWTAPVPSSQPSGWTGRRLTELERRLRYEHHSLMTPTFLGWQTSRPAGSGG